MAERKASSPPVIAYEPVPGFAWRRYLIPTVLAVLNATAFMILQPGVEDLWAARARAYAASHGVGLTYWFGWFGGASTPGNYSVITPYLSALISAELLGALAAVAITVLSIPLLRGTRYPLAGVLIVTIGAASNLWSGRVPFLLGTAFTLAAFIAVRHQRRVLASVGALLSVFASPVTGAFLAAGLAGTFLARKKHRPISLVTIATTVVSLGVVALVFGNPGPEHFTYYLCLSMMGGMILTLFAWPADYVRATVWLCIMAAGLLYLIPNGMGSNFARIAWFYVPVAVVATSSRKLWITLLLVLPLVIGGVDGGVTDVRKADQPQSTVGYYTPLANELDRIPALQNFRLEVVNLTSHAADAALLDHAMLARGWETQEERALNGILQNKLLNATSYKVWLDNNAVGYVAIPVSKNQAYPEYALVESGTLPYLQRVWQSKDWQLFRVGDANPVVGGPNASMVSHSQSKLMLRVNRAGTFTVRVRWSKFLRSEDTTGKFSAKVLNDGYGWTKITTTGPGIFSLHGTISRLFD